MRIGLIRHFAVDLRQEKYLSSREFEEWVKAYDLSPVIPGEVRDWRKDWDQCYCSSQQRAVDTARHFYQGEINQTDLLREVALAPIIKTSRRMHFLFWFILGRIAWNFSHKSQKETKAETMDRVDRFISKIEKSQSKNILVVSHGFFMKLLQKELAKRGFKGHRMLMVEHGKLYIYEKEEFLND